MLTKVFFFIPSIFLLYSPLCADPSLTQHDGEHIGWTSMYRLPQADIEQHFSQVREAVEYRWNVLTGQDAFPLYSPERDKQAIVDEFYKFSNMRIQLWLDNPCQFPCRSNPLFKVSQALLSSHRFRQPGCISFEHSATDPSYNSSSISIGKRRFFALEGPTEEHAPYFFRLLNNWNVSYVVCLTSETDASGTPKCYPYWKGRIVQNDQGRFLRVTIDGAYEQSPTSWGTQDIPYLFWPDWQDFHGVNPKELVEGVNQVRNHVKEGEIIAVHCSAGVGRTGTFIAALCLLDEIDKQLAAGVAPDRIQISIAKLFLYLNFHRPWLVSKPGQYLTLYRTVSWYLYHFGEIAS